MSEPFWIPVGDLVCLAPGRLRHSWLDNEVLLVLGQAAEQRIPVRELERLVANWMAEYAELKRYADAFPGIVDPGEFLKEFAEVRGVRVAAVLIDGLSARFAASFDAVVGVSVKEFKRMIGEAATTLGDALERLGNEIEQSARREHLEVRELSSAPAALGAALRLHDLLGKAPRGVWLT